MPEKVRFAVENSFPVSPVPSIETIAADPDDYECLEVLSRLVSKQWSDLSEEDLRPFGSFDETLANLSARGLVYYLPAFLLCALRHDSDDSIVSSVVLFIVGNRVEISPAALAVFRLLTDRQAGALEMFLSSIESSYHSSRLVGIAIGCLKTARRSLTD